MLPTIPESDSNSTVSDSGSVIEALPPDEPFNVHDALRYLDSVKNAYYEQPDKYQQFLDIMKEFKRVRIDTPEVIQRVAKLFHDQKELIKGFNLFLPKGWSITAVSTDTVSVTTPVGSVVAQIDKFAQELRNRRIEHKAVFERATHFLKNLKAYSPDGNERFWTFVLVFYGARVERIQASGRRSMDGTPIAEKTLDETMMLKVHNRLVTLYEDHPEVAVQFKEIFIDGLPITPDPDSLAAYIETMSLRSSSEDPVSNIE